MYRYQVKLWPEKAKAESVNLEPTLNTVLAIATEYSNEAQRATNRKWIEEESISIFKDCIELILCSESWLNFPTKALRAFISRLSKTPEYARLITDSGRLFKGNAVFLQQTIMQESLSDEETLIAVTKLFFRKNEDSRKKINAIKAIIGGGVNV